MTLIHRLDISVRNRVAELRERAHAESEQGDIIDKVIIVAATAGIAIAAMAAISALVDAKVMGIKI
jgi:hypothetical protein